MNGGTMNGFDRLVGCSEAEGYACYSSYRHDRIPNLWQLASTYAVSDRTFQMDTVPSWGAHLELVAATLNGFTGDNPVKANGHPLGLGWGCDSYRVAPWQDPGSGKVSDQPSCVPDQNGNGPFRPSAVSSVPTIMDRLDEAGLSWKLYASAIPPGQPRKKANPYGPSVRRSRNASTRSRRRTWWIRTRSSRTRPPGTCPTSRSSSRISAAANITATR
jgi:phospholipase C